MRYTSQYRYPYWCLTIEDYPLVSFFRKLWISFSSLPFLRQHFINNFIIPYPIKGFYISKKNPSDIIWWVTIEGRRNVMDNAKKLILTWSRRSESRLGQPAFKLVCCSIFCCCCFFFLQIPILILLLQLVVIFQWFYTILTVFIILLHQ